MAFVSRNIYESRTASDITSETYRVSDFQDNFTIQIVGSPSTTTLQGSNDPGNVEAITNWSQITTVVGAGLVGVTPGFRWFRALRSETTSATVGGWQRRL